MVNLALAITLVLAILFLVPFLVYGLATVVAGVKPPEGVPPSRFLSGVLVSKFGTALAFVGIFHLGRGALDGHWLLYAALWWLAFFTDEVGQAIRSSYTWKEAVAGVLSETLYLPISAYLTHRLIGSN